MASTTTTKSETVHDSFTIQRSYRSAPDRVFRAFAEEEIKRRWFAEGPGFIVGSYRLDFRVGGKEMTAFSVDTPDFKSDEIRYDSYYFDIVTDQRIVYGYSMANEGATFSASLATITLEPDRSGGTKLTFHEHLTFFGSADGVRMRELGTRQLLERMAEEFGEPSEKVDWNAS